MPACTQNFAMLVGLAETKVRATGKGATSRGHHGGGATLNRHRRPSDHSSGERPYGNRLETGREQQPERRPARAHSCSGFDSSLAISVGYRGPMGVGSLRVKSAHPAGPKADETRT